MQKDHKLKLNQALHLIDSDSRGLFVEALSEKIGEAVDKTRGKTAIVQSAVELTGGERTRIEALIKKILKREIDIYFRISPSLLGGFTITVGDWKLDASLNSQLEILKTSLNS